MRETAPTRPMLEDLRVDVGRDGEGLGNEIASQLIQYALWLETLTVRHHAIGAIVRMYMDGPGAPCHICADSSVKRGQP